MNIFELDKGAYELNDFEKRFLKFLFNFYKDKDDRFSYLNYIDFDKLVFKYAPILLIDDQGIFGCWNITYNNIVFLRPSAFDKRFIEYVENNYDKESVTYKMYAGLNLNIKNNPKILDNEKFNQLSDLIGIYANPSDENDLKELKNSYNASSCMFLTILHELFHKYQFMRNPISYVFKFFIGLFMGYDNSFLEKEVREKIDNVNVFKDVKNYMICFDTFNSIAKFDETISKEYVEKFKAVNDKKLCEESIKFCKEENIYSSEIFDLLKSK